MGPSDGSNTQCSDAAPDSEGEVESTRGIRVVLDNLVPL